MINIYHAYNSHPPKNLIAIGEAGLDKTDTPHHFAVESSFQEASSRLVPSATHSTTNRRNLGSPHLLSHSDEAHQTTHSTHTQAKKTNNPNIPTIRIFLTRIFPRGPKKRTFATNKTGYTPPTHRSNTIYLPPPVNWTKETHQSPARKQAAKLTSIPHTLRKPTSTP